MKRSFVLSIAIISIVLSLFVSCASSKTEETKVVEEVEKNVEIEEIEKVEEVIVEEPIKAEIIDGYLYINNHRVDIYLDGGSVVGDVDALLESANASGYIELPTVEKDGYVFLGWIDLNTGSYDNRSTIELSSIESDMKLKADLKLDVASTAISFEEDGNAYVIKAEHPVYSISVKAPKNSMVSVSVDEIMKNAIENEEIVIPSISMTDYIFLGWVEDGKDEAQESVTIKLDGNTGSRSFGAFFTPDLSKATFDSGVDGDKAWFKASLLGLSIKVNAPVDSAFYGDMDSIVAEAVSSNVLTLPTLNKRGYDFKGWRIVGEEKVEENPSIDILSMTKSLEYEAVFERIVYSIEYDEIGVEYVAKVEKPVITPVFTASVTEEIVIEEEKNPDSYTIEDSFTLINPTRVGYTFIGWIREGEESYEARKTEELALGTTGDVKYITVWVPNEYKITLDPNGGELKNAPVSFTFDAPSFTLPAPEKKDYVFVGWKSGDKDPVREYVVDTTVPKSISLKAVWTPREYTIEYNKNIVLYSPKPEPIPEPEPLPENPESYTVLDSFTLYNPEIDGYTFMGWIEEGEESYEAKAVYSLPKGSSGNRKLSAVWIPNEYSISYDLNGGKIEGEEPKSFTFNSDSPLFIEPTLENYVFQGWIDTERETEPFKTLDTTVPGDKSLKAVWKPYEFSISYDLDGGELSEDAVTSYTVESESFTTVAPVKSGYEFVGWTNKDDATSCLFSLSLLKEEVRTSFFNDAEPLEIYTSLFDKKTKAMISEAMNKAGVSGIIENGVLKVAYEDLDTEEILTLVSSILKNTQIVVDGTYYGSKAIVPFVTVEAGRTGDIALKAVWKVITYTIDYDEDGVIFGSDLNRKAENACWYTVESAFQVINPEKKGYDFVGWILEGEPTSKARSIYEFSKGTTGDKNLVAVWMPSVYSITIDTKGGKIDEYPTSYSYMEKEITIPTPCKENYDFLGWRVEGNEDELISRYVIKKGDLGDVSLKAEWASTVYTVKYDLAGGALSEGVENPTSYTVEDKDIVLAVPTRFGYTFLGWTENPFSTYRTYALRYIIDTSRGEDLKITAKWAPVEYKITYVLDGGSYRYDNTNPTKYTIETEGVYLANPVKSGYTFQGWIVAGDKTETLKKGLVIPAGSTGDVKIYAIWEKNTVGVGEVTKMQIDQMVYGKDGFPRPDWVVKTPEGYGYHYEKAFSDNPDLYEALAEASAECGKLFSQWIGTKYEMAVKTVDDTSYQTSGVEYSNTVRGAEIVEYWQEENGRTWVLMRIDVDFVNVD